jgi:hypothetical protein
LSNQGLTKASRESKRNRSRRRERRNGKIARLESREEDTYQSGIALQPQAFDPALRDGFKGKKGATYSGMPLTSSPRPSLSNATLVFFDLETTGNNSFIFFVSKTYRINKIVKLSI